MFSIGLSFIIPTIVVNSIVPKFFHHRDLWEDRELPSRTYGWVAFCTATLVCEIPLAIVSGTLYFLLSYFAVGFSTEPSTCGYVYLMMILFSIFQASWGQWMAAFAPTYSVVANVSYRSCPEWCGHDGTDMLESSYFRSSSSWPISSTASSFLST